MKKLFVVISVIFLVIVSFLWYIGLFTTIKIEEKVVPQYVMAGLEFVGDYSDSAPVFEKVDSIVSSLDCKSSRAIGIYFDNPKEVAPKDCRSFLGSVVDSSFFDKISLLKEHGLRIDTIKSSNALVIEFPIRSNLSFMIGPMKAYPALSKYYEDNKLSCGLVYELYDIHNKKAFYIMQYNKE